MRVPASLPHDGVSPFCLLPLKTTASISRARVKAPPSAFGTNKYRFFGVAVTDAAAHIPNAIICKINALLDMSSAQRRSTSLFACKGKPTTTCKVVQQLATVQMSCATASPVCVGRAFGLRTECVSPYLVLLSG